MREANLLCAACYLGAYDGIICCAGYEPENCKAFKQEYKCRGGLCYDHPVTKEACRECAQTCKGCLAD